MKRPLASWHVASVKEGRGETRPRGIGLERGKDRRNRGTHTHTDVNADVHDMAAVTGQTVRR